MEGNSPARTYALDGIRGLGAIAVLAFHVWLFGESHSTQLRENWWDWFFAELSLGLYLFFVLSGYLLFRPFLARRTGDRAWQGARVYVRKRVVRIVPLYYVTLVAAIALLYTGSDRLGPHLPPENMLWTYFLFLQNYSMDTILRLNDATWTLPVEVAFYVLVPFIGLWIAARRDRLGHAAALAVVLVALGAIWNYLTLEENAVWRLALPAMLPYFAFGLLAAVAVEWWQRREAVAGDKRTGHLLMAAGIALVAIDVTLRESMLDSDLVEVLRASIAGVGFALIIVAATAGRAGERLLGSRLLVWFGAISYGVFLWQVPLILAVRDRGWLPDSVWTALPLVLALTIAAAVVTRRLVEQPVERWAANRRQRSQNPPVKITS